MLRSRALSAAAFLVASLPAYAGTEGGPVEVVRKLNAGLEAVLRESGKLDYKARYERLGPLLDDAFDFPFMARQAVGHPWEDLSPDDQQRWVSAFRDFTTSTYAARFDRYSGQSFETLGEEPSNHETVMVRSRVVDPAAENVDLTYRLRAEDGPWKVIDVYLKGSVSEVALRRSEFASMLKRDGFEALLAAVKGKIADLAAGKAP